MNRNEAIQKLRGLIQELDYFISHKKPQNSAEAAARHEARMLREKLIARVQSLDVAWV